MVWENGVFDKRSAWIDLILMANHEDNKFLFGNQIIYVKRGEFITSEKKLMSRWGWSKNKLRSFILLLENDKMIVKKSDHKKTTISIVNYGKYQDKQTSDNTSKEPVKVPLADQYETSNGPQTRMNKKEQEGTKNENEVSSTYRGRIVDVSSKLPPH